MEQSQSGNVIKNTKSTHNSYVKFADVKMVTLKSVSGTILTRRNKWLFLILFSLVLFFIFLLNIGVFTSAPTYNGELCKLDEIQVQGSFDKKKFSGKWYATLSKGLENSLLATLMDFYDVKINFILKDNGAYDLKSVGGKFYGMWCPEGLGHMEARDAQYPQKMAIFFDTPTGKKFGTKPVWVLKTDYTSYAVMYSCWEETDDGRCKGKSAYIAVLQRSREPLSDGKMEEINAAVTRSCINPKALRKIKHDGYCKSQQDAIS